MIKILVVAATPAEAAFLSRKIKTAETGKPFPLPSSLNLQIDVLITGPGIASTAFYLGKNLAIKKYDLAINIGICGSLDPKILPVRIVNIIADQFGDFGAEDGRKNLDIFETGLIKKNIFPFKNGMLNATYQGKLSTLKALPRVKGITVQRVHGSSATIKNIKEKFGNVMESMEGAAFFYACNLESVPCLQIRSVSNKVERRNRKNWKIDEAISALAGFTGLMLLEMENLSDTKRS